MTSAMHLTNEEEPGVLDTRMGTTQGLMTLTPASEEGFQGAGGRGYR
jgi:hypothetical protein